MSSNALARSRPRIRHQRVPKTQSYSHPRFLQLCKELARLDEVKNKPILPSSSSEHCDKTKDDCEKSLTSSTIATSCYNNDDCTITLDTTTSGLNYCNNNNNNGGTRRGQLAQQTTSCAGIINNIEAHSSNGFRSINLCNSAQLYPGSQYRQTNSDHHHHHHNHPHNHDHSHRNSCCSNSIINQQQYHLHEPNRFSNTASLILHQSHNYHHHQPHQNHHHHHHHSQVLPMQSCSKFGPINLHQSSAASSSLATLSSSSSSRVIHQPQKIVAPAQGSTILSTSSMADSTDQLYSRQDENNRSKRKRSSSNEFFGAKRSSSAGSMSPSSSTSKRNKSSPEPARPLSPSFTKCPICLLDCMDKDPSFTNTCFHLFCFSCIENWSKSKATCPLCRTKFSKIIYNIKSTGCFDEKIVSPIRRDDDDDRVIYEHLQSITSNPLLTSSASSASTSQSQQPPSRSSQRPYAWMEQHTRQFRFVDPINYQQQQQHSQQPQQQPDPLNRFNTIPTSSSNTGTNTISTSNNHNNSNNNNNSVVGCGSSGNNNTSGSANAINLVPHSLPFMSYNPYINLLPNNPASRLQPVTTTAITSAYGPNSGVLSLTNSNHDSTSNHVTSSGRLSRTSRSGRYIHQRNYEMPSDSIASRVSRSANSSGPSTNNGSDGGTSVTLERQPPHIQTQPQHGGHLASAVVGAVPAINLAPRNDGSIIEIGALLNNISGVVSSERGVGPRTGTHPYLAEPYFPTTQHQLNPTRGPYSNIPVDQHIINHLYGTQEPM